MTGEQKYEYLVKETEKARCIRINGIDFWVPKAAIMWLKEENNTLMLYDWFAKDMLDEGVLLSDDKKHKFIQWRRWGSKGGSIALCIGLNPKWESNSPTIKRLTDVLQKRGYSGFRMVNLYTLITKNPADLMDAEKCGSEQVAMNIISAYAINAADVIFCWGTFAEAKARASRVIEFFSNALCFGRNQDGSPWHPMSLHYAGLKPASTYLFKFSEHTFEKNRYDRKEKKKKMEYNEKQLSIIPNENL